MEGVGEGEVENLGRRGRDDVRAAEVVRVVRDISRREIDDARFRLEVAATC